MILDNFLDPRCKLVSPLLFFVVTTLFSVQAYSQTDAKSPTGNVGQALGLLFDAHRTPQAKSMGLLQGNFLDALETRGSLQLAFVIDGSESMENQIESIGENLGFLVTDLDRVLDGSVGFSVVTYSDVGDKPVPVSVHNPSFVNATEIKETVSNLSVSSGRPYFHEAIDLGVHRAISELPWSTQPDVTKWIMVIGDAPPFESAFAEKSTGAKRWYETELLVDLANQNGINIHCLLCPSRESEKKSFESVLDDTRDFMSHLSTDTGGLMLDMSYDQVRKSLAESAGRVRTEYMRLGHISQKDIDDVQANVGDEDSAIRIIVLPLMPLEDISFFHQREEMQVATEIQTLLKQIPNVRVVPPRLVENQIAQLKSEGVATKDWPRALCFRLRSQFVLTGELRSAQDLTSANVQLHSPKNEAPLATANVSAQTPQLARLIISQLAETRNADPQLLNLIQRLKTFVAEKKIDTTEIGTLSQLKDEERQWLLSGLTALEQAVGYAQGDLNSISLLKAAEDSLTTFLAAKPDHPYANMLMASVRFNLAAALETAGSVDEAKATFKDAMQSIRVAFANKRQLVDELVKLELEGDYELLIRKDFGASIASYQTIAKTSGQTPLNSALHAHWMLAGIRSGDWGVEQADASVLNLDESRAHLIQILAHWPDSPQANLIRKNMMWDQRNNRTRSPYFARLAQSYSAG